MDTFKGYPVSRCSATSSFVSRRQNCVPRSPLREGVYPVRMLSERGMSETSHLADLGHAASASLHATGVVECLQQQESLQQQLDLERSYTAPSRQSSSTEPVVEEPRPLSSSSTLCPNTPEDPSLENRYSSGEENDYFTGTHNTHDNKTRAVPATKETLDNKTSKTNTTYDSFPLSSTETLPLLLASTNGGAKQDEDEQEERKRAIHCSRHMKDHHCPCATCARFRRTRRQRPRSSRGRSQSRSCGTTVTDTWKPAISLPAKKFSLLAAATALRDATPAIPGAASNGSNPTPGKPTCTEAGAQITVSKRKSRSTVRVAADNSRRVSDRTATDSCPAAPSKLCSPNSPSELFTPVSELSLVGMLFEYKERLGRLRIRQQDATSRCEEHHMAQKNRIRQAINIDFGYVKSESVIWEERLKKLEAEEKDVILSAQKLDLNNYNKEDEDYHDTEGTSNAFASPKHNKGVVCPRLKKLTTKAAKAFFRQLLMIKRITELEQDHQLDLAALHRHHLRQNHELLEEYPAINSCLCASRPLLSKTVRQQSYWRPLLVAITDKKNWEVPHARGMDW